MLFGTRGQKMARQISIGIACRLSLVMCVESRLRLVPVLDVSMKKTGDICVMGAVRSTNAEKRG
jgi:hypothetical protein